MGPKDIEIIYRDEDMLVVNKPAGISVTTDRSGLASVPEVLSRRADIGRQHLRLVHRLDKETSGVMVMALNIDAQRELSKAFAERRVKKSYLALVRGGSSCEQGTISSPIGPDRKNGRLMCVDPVRGKDAITNWRLVADFGGLRLILARPRTGRTHQIRVHFAAVARGVACDALYGSAEPIFLSQYKRGYRPAKGKAEKPLLDRLALHSYQLGLLVDAGGSGPFIAPLDRKFKATLKMLVKHNPQGRDAVFEPDVFDRILNAQPTD